MTATKIFPIILMSLDLGAAVVYAIGGDWKHSVYWAAATTLTASITF